MQDIYKLELMSQWVSVLIRKEHLDKVTMGKWMTKSWNSILTGRCISSQTTRTLIRIEFSNSTKYRQKQSKIEPLISSWKTRKITMPSQMINQITTHIISILKGMMEPCRISSITRSIISKVCRELKFIMMKDTLIRVIKMLDPLQISGVKIKQLRIKMPIRAHTNSSTKSPSTKCSHRWYRVLYMQEIYTSSKEQNLCSCHKCLHSNMSIIEGDQSFILTRNKTYCSNHQIKTCKRTKYSSTKSTSRRLRSKQWSSTWWLTRLLARMTQHISNLMIAKDSFIHSKRVKEKMKTTRANKLARGPKTLKIVSLSSIMSFKGLLSKF